MDAKFSLPVDCSIRPAIAADLGQIRWLVFRARLDPSQLRWTQFWVIECAGKVVACGQLCSFEGAQELGSVVVAAEWRDRGLGSFLVQHLIGQASQPLYLECLGSRLEQFYQRFGFARVEFAELPRSLQRKFGLSRAIAGVLRLPLVILKAPSLER